jgi:hypothetical protein
MYTNLFLSFRRLDVDLLGRAIGLDGSHREENGGDNSGLHNEDSPEGNVQRNERKGIGWCTCFVPLYIALRAILIMKSTIITSILFSVAAVQAYRTKGKE